MRTYLYILIVLLISSTVSTTLNAKKKTFEGFVVTASSDTIFGQVYYVSPTANELKVKIKDQNNKKHSFKSKSLKSYSFKVSKYNQSLKKHVEVWVHFVAKTVEDAPVRFGTKNILIQQKVAGALKVFSQYYEVDKKIGGTLGQCYYVEKSNKALDFTKVTKANYKKVMKSATKDLPALSDKIGTRGYGYKHISKIAKMYNDLKNGNQTDPHAN